jgi:hypothetical protein
MSCDKFLALLLVIFLFSSSIAQNNTTYFDQLWRSHPFYFGPILGYGSTDWSMLVVNCEKGDKWCNPELLATSAPTAAGDDGFVWGGTIGIEVRPSWAIEASFMRFPSTSVFFGNQWSFYSDKHNVHTMRSKTWGINLVGKFMTEIACTGLRGFANAGVNFTSREDLILNTIRANPTFGVGLNYAFPERIMLEIAFQYVTGFGRANEVPVNYYIPFLYTIHLKILYRI